MLAAGKRFRSSTLSTEVAKAPLQAGSAAPPPRPLPSVRLRLVARIVIRGIFWALLMLAVMLATAATFWIALAVVMLGSAPQGKAIIGLAVVIGFAAAMFWLVGKYIAPRRVVGGAVAVTVTALLITGTGWAVLIPTTPFSPPATWPGESRTSLTTRNSHRARC
jgi:hypothetical protein